MRLKQTIRCAQLGFSLAEVTMAIGIAAIGVVSLVGLMPAGLESLRQSSSQVAEAKILQAVSADFQMGDWGKRADGQKLQDREYYFDEKGFPVEKTDFWRHFTVRARIEADTPTADGLTLTGDATPNRYLYRLVTKITDEQDAETAFTDLTGKDYQTYSSLVAIIEQTENQNDIK